MPLLKSKCGSTGFTRRTRLIHPNGAITFDNVRYEFSMDNDCRCNVPDEVWSELENEWFDKKNNLQYKDVFITL